MKCICGYECDESGYNESGEEMPFIDVIGRYTSHPDMYGMTHDRKIEFGREIGVSWNCNFVEIYLYACPKCGTVRMER